MIRLNQARRSAGLYARDVRGGLMHPSERLSDRPTDLVRASRLHRDADLPQVPRDAGRHVPGDEEARGGPSRSAIIAAVRRRSGRDATCGCNPAPAGRSGRTADRSACRRSRRRRKAASCRRCCADWYADRFCVFCRKEFGRIHRSDRQACAPDAGSSHHRTGTSIPPEIAAKRPRDLASRSAGTATSPRSSTSSFRSS